VLSGSLKGNYTASSFTADRIPALNTLSNGRLHPIQVSAWRLCVCCGLLLHGGASLLGL